jgi:hypothetical protein
VSQHDPTHPDTPSGRRAARAALALTAAFALALGVAACGDDDDGADVRSSGPGASGGSGSASGSGSGSASAPASGSGSGSASASGVATECQAIDGADGVADADTTVAVTLDEFSIVADPGTAPAGAVGFISENAGTEDHELVIARGAPSDITVVDGAPDEAALGDALVGEIEAFAAGQTCEGTFELTAGDYVLFCALVEEEGGTVVSHYEEGMVTTFTVS